MKPSIDDEIARYVLTGKCDPHHSAWPGDFFERARLAHDDLRGALVRATRRAARTRRARGALPADLDVVNFTRTKVEPMVRGLFLTGEQEAVLATLQRSAVFVGAENIEELLRTTSSDSTAWNLSNMYLESLGAKLLGQDAPRLVGLSEETTFYVSLDYFRDEDPFADFIVHEAAHVFHNCKRRTIGLAETRRKEWLLNIDFHKRETFAYACEVLARIVDRAPRPRDRSALAAEYVAGKRFPSEERVDQEELVDIIREAAAARNGWKRILARCAPPPPPTRREWLESVMRAQPGSFVDP